MMMRMVKAMDLIERGKLKETALEDKQWASI